MTYASLEDLHQRWCARLRGAGVEKGAVMWVMWQPPDPADQLALFLAMMTCGATVLFVQPKISHLHQFLNSVHATHPTAMLASPPVWFFTNCLKILGYLPALTLGVMPHRLKPDEK